MANGFPHSGDETRIGVSAKLYAEMLNEGLDEGIFRDVEISGNKVTLVADNAGLGEIKWAAQMVTEGDAEPEQIEAAEEVIRRIDSL